MKIAAATVASNYEELNNNQSKLVQYINENPGIRYRELLRLTSLANGVLTYHLSVLEKSHQIKVDRNKNSKITRYYPINIPSEESEILGCIRGNVIRQIILSILEHDLCTFDEIVEHTKKAPSTISWYLKRLKAAAIISVQYGHGEYQQLYKLTNRDIVAEILYKYKESFVDKVVNNYTEMVEEF
jgi:predicted transcriptional regulator